jgi:hypothetical protein
MADLISILSPVIDRSYKVRREYRTEIFVARSGQEQRRSLRAVPRRSIEYQTTLSETNARTFAREMVTAQGREMILPARPPIHDALTGYFRTEISTAHRWRTATEVTVAFDVSPGSEEAEDPGAPAASFENREVWLSKPNFFDPIDVRYAVDRETMDAGHGILAHFFPTDFAGKLWQARYTTLEPGKAEIVRALFTRMMGQRGEFFMPSHDNDIPPLSQAGAGTSSLTTAGTEVFNFYDDHPAYRCICVTMPDGSFHFRRVTNIVPSGGNSVLTVSSPWSVAIPTTAVVSWMPTWRFATDIFEVDWVMDVSARTSLSLLMLHDNPAEVDATGEAAGIGAAAGAGATA